LLTFPLTLFIFYPRLRILPYKKYSTLLNLTFKTVSKYEKGNHFLLSIDIFSEKSLNKVSRMLSITANRGAERPKTAKCDTTLQRGAFRESGWSGRDCGYKAGAMWVKADTFHLKSF